MIRCHQQMETEALILGNPRRLGGEIDEGTEKYGIMTAMVKDLVDLEEAALRREAMRMRLVLCSALVGRGVSGMRKGFDAAAELTALMCSSWR